MRSQQSRKQDGLRRIGIKIVAYSHRVSVYRDHGENHPRTTRQSAICSISAEEIGKDQTRTAIGKDEIIGVQSVKIRGSKSQSSKTQGCKTQGYKTQGYKTQGSKALDSGRSSRGF